MLFSLLCFISFVCFLFVCVVFFLCPVVHAWYLLRACFLPFLVLFVDVGVACLFGVVLLLVFET